MADYRLSDRAERDLIEIYGYTEATYGAYQAEAYHAGLERTFDLLASFPRIGRPMDEIAPGCRQFRFQWKVGWASAHQIARSSSCCWAIEDFRRYALDRRRGALVG